MRLKKYRRIKSRKLQNIDIENWNSFICNRCDNDIMSTDDLFIKIYSKIFPKNVNNNSININFNNSINANNSFAKEEKKENIENFKEIFSFVFI